MLHVFGPERVAAGGEAVEFRVDAWRYLAALGAIGRFAMRGARGEIIVDAFAKSRFDLGKAAAYEGHDIAQADDAADKDAVIRRDGAGITLVFKHRRLLRGTGLRYSCFGHHSVQQFRHDQIDCIFGRKYFLEILLRPYLIILVLSCALPKPIVIIDIV